MSPEDAAEGSKRPEEVKPRRPSTGEAHDSAKDAKKSAAKKRTKTGCLTCRRRRIKCDEGKPRCNNCIKSKRQCDGYNQRVIFKDPMGTFQGGHTGPVLFQSHPHQGMLNAHQMSAAASNARPMSQGPLPLIAPRPPGMTDMATSAAVPGLPSYPGQRHFTPHQHAVLAQPHPPHHHPLPMTVHPGNSSFVEYVPAGALDPNANYSAYPPPWDQESLSTANAREQRFFQPPHISAASAEEQISPPSVSSAQPASTADTIKQEWDSGDRKSAGKLPASSAQPSEYVSYDDGGDVKKISAGLKHVESQEPYWFSDDEASLAESEDEGALNSDLNQATSDLGALVARRLHHSAYDTYGTQMRTFSAFSDADILANYVPSALNSPLNDSQTAAVFWYFVNITGPSVSLYERHPVDPSIIFQGQPVPKIRQHIWAYKFPIIALNHPALLHSMLALGSLQMAKLQNIPATAAMKHYHLSIRRLARNYQSPSRRVQPATLAATMLLSFYEVWNSDHEKWCKHMWGAQAILKEIPLSDMTRKIIALKREQRQHLYNADLHLGAAPFANAIVADKDIDQVDATLVGQLAGRAVSFAQETDHSHVYTPTSGPAPSWTVPDHYTEKDIEIYEMVADVSWWHAKMDVYQSILGGTPLIMEYNYWTECCPRAPIGKIDAIFGTYDHLMLLLGRLCNFAARDLSRKRKALKKPEGPNGQGQSPPPFVGMMPATGHVTIPKGFSPPRETTPQSEGSEEIDLEASTAKALADWGAIRQTFELFRAQLGPDFEPLGPEYEPPANSPFGMVLKYRTYGVAGIWMNYFMGLIVLSRCHPSMPPIALAAAGLSARQTAPFANDIGRIICGLSSEDISKLPHASRVYGAVSIESSFPLFVAAVQYQDTAQRHWTVRHLINIERLTGWQSARQIAMGCEVSWTKAASLGRGPPYTPPEDTSLVPQNNDYRPRRIIDRIRELEDEGPVVLSSSERPHYAIGLLSMETDLERLDLGDNE